jgi:hypothetical protein
MPFYTVLLFHEKKTLFFTVYSIKDPFLKNYLEIK